MQDSYHLVSAIMKPRQSSNLTIACHFPDGTSRISLMILSLLVWGGLEQS
jgi:hypothetical protein